MGGEPWPDNPALTVPPPCRDLVRLWAACRGGMGGLAHWPDAGGVGDQAAWVVDAFTLLAGMDAAMDAEQRRMRGGG